MLDEALPRALSYFPGKIDRALKGVRESIESRAHPGITVARHIPIWEGVQDGRKSELQESEKGPTTATTESRPRPGLEVRRTGWLSQ